MMPQALTQRQSLTLLCTPLVSNEMLSTPGLLWIYLLNEGRYEGQRLLRDPCGPREPRLQL